MAQFFYITNLETMSFAMTHSHVIACVVCSFYSISSTNSNLPFLFTFSFNIRTYVAYFCPSYHYTLAFYASLAYVLNGYLK
jgi:hypothetical protein